jgi:solute carrier family 32 (vesicular inhibitory amino acid transporter)
MNATDDINIKPSASMMSPGAQNRRTFFNRAFGKLEKGSVRGSTLSLCAAAIGGGILSLPYTFEIVGYGIGYALFFVGCFAGIWSCLLLAKLATNHRLKNYD